MITFEEYTEKVKGFMNPKVLENPMDIISNALMGMAGESGEAIDHLKKHLYHEQPLDLDKLDKEVGDSLFYNALYAVGRDILLSDIAQTNVDKLNARYEGKPWSPDASKAKRDEVVVRDNGTDWSKKITLTNE